MEFGFTNNKEEYDRVIKFRDDAVKDGWSIEPSYGTHESVERASTLKKNGYTMSVISREKIGKWEYEADISIWADDGLSVAYPDIYNFDAIEKGKRHCNLCDADDVDTQRYSFAGRCCAKCRPEAAKKYEYPGWAD